MMISEVIQNDHHLLIGGAMAKEVFQEFTRSLPVEFVPLLSHQSAIPQTDSSKHPDQFAAGTGSCFDTFIDSKQEFCNPTAKWRSTSKIDI